MQHTIEGSRSGKITFRCIPEGRGNTFALPSADKITHVGTVRLVTCVGVYLPLAFGRCFAAHINAAVLRPGLRNSVFWGCNESEGRLIQQQVGQKLKDHAAKHGWTTADVLKEGIIVACPLPVIESSEIQASRGLGEDKMTGWFIIEGLKDFLGVQDIDARKNAGFVVDQEQPAEHKLLTYFVPGSDPAGKAEIAQEMAGFDGMQAPGAETEDWYIKIHQQVVDLR